MLREKTKSYSMESLFRTIKKSRQHYWQIMSKESATINFEKEIIDIVLDWREKHSKVGSRVLYYMIKNSGKELGIGINKFERLLSKHNLTVGKIKSDFPKTSDGKGRNNYPNLTHGLVLNGINQLIVGDITYYLIGGKWHYIFTLKDVYSQRILGLVPSRNMQSENAMQCLGQMLEVRDFKALKDCIHHTDDGSQYNATKYIEALTKLKIKISRSTICQENGSAEQFNHIVKNMYFVGWSINTFEDLQRACKKFMYLNNYERAIKQLGYITPVAFEEKIKDIKAEDRIKKRLHDFREQTAK